MDSSQLSPATSQPTPTSTASASPTNANISVGALLAATLKHQKSAANAATLISPERKLFMTLVDNESVLLCSPSFPIHAYQCYIVEQWVTDRTRPVKTVVAYTGDKNHRINVCSITIPGGLPSDSQPSPPSSSSGFTLAEIFCENPSVKSKWIESPPDGRIQVTNLATLSSSLNIIHVPNGDYEAHIPSFNLNMNLRRLGCSGRNAITLNPPTAAQFDRFVDMYKITERGDVSTAVFEMVKLSQASLFLLGHLRKNFSDGVLCDETSRAFVAYQEKFGPQESEGTLCSPQIIAGLFSKILTVRNKIHALGIQSPKNPFGEVDLFLSSILQLQKAHKLENAMILNSETLDKLDEAFKNRFDDIAGNHLQIDIETTNLEHFLSICNVDAFRSIWGKKAKPSTHEVAVLAEEILSGSKEIGKNILKNVSNRAPKLPDNFKDKALVRGLKQGVAGGISKISKISSSVEGFVDKRRPKFMNRRLEDVSDAGIDTEYEEMLMVDTSPVYQTFSKMGMARRRLSSKECSDRSLEPVSRKFSLPFLEFEEADESIEIGKALDALRRKEAETVEATENLKAISEAYAVKIQALSDIYVENYRNFSSVENAVNDLIELHKLVQQRIEAMETRNAKVQYDITVLEEKIAETDDTIENFKAKYAALDSVITQEIHTRERLGILNKISERIGAWFQR